MQDVIIIGGGMAGYSLACALGHQGLEVTVLERETELPRLIKGECLTALGVEMAAELGILPHLLEAGGQKIRRYKRWLWEHSLEIPIDQHAPGAIWALTIKQDRYLQSLLRAAESVPGVTVRRGVRVTGLLQEEGRTAGVTTLGEPLRARLVVAADGRKSQARAWIGAKTTTKRTDRFAAGGLIQYAGPADEVTITQTAPGEAAITVPFSDGTMRIGVLFGRERLDEFRANPRAAWLKRLERLPILQGAPWQALPDEVHMCDCPDLECDRVAGDGVVLAGDAAGVVDPITGLGLMQALHDAWLLSNLIPRALAAGAGATSVLKEYERLRQDLFRRCRAYTLKQMSDTLYAKGLMLALLGAIYRRMNEQRRFREYFLPEIYGSPRPLTAGNLLRQLFGWPLPSGPAVTPADLVHRDRLMLQEIAVGRG